MSSEVRQLGWDKGPTGLLGDEEGESWWMPQPMGGYVTLKYVPATFPNNMIANGFQVLPAGGEIPQQAHRACDKLWYVMAGSGEATVDGKTQRVSQGSLVAGGRNVSMGMRNDGQEDLKIFFTVWPPGLEEAYAAIGRPRTPGDAAPEPFDAPANWKELMRPARWADDEPAREAGLKKGGALVVGPDESDDFWQPPPGGYIYLKLSPKNYPSNYMIVGGQVLPPGGFIPSHAHTANEEVLLVVKGSGYVVVDEQRLEVGPGSLAYVDRWVRHSFVNTGDEDMLILVTFHPPGLEKLLSSMGPRRQRHEQAPDPALFPPMDPAVMAQALRGATLCMPDKAMEREQVLIPPKLDGSIDYGD